MIQRSIYQALVAGFEAVQADPGILDDIFGERGYALTTTEIAAIKTYFAATEVNVAHGYARSDQKFPLVMVVLTGEDEDEHWLGDDAGIVMDTDDPEHGSDLVSSTWKHNYDLLVLCEHPDATLYIYEVVKSIMLTSESFFHDAAIYFTHFNGMDLAPDPRYIPEHLFVRKLTMSCKREFLRVVRGSRLDKAFAVDGIFIDKSGSPSDAGVTNTNLTPYTPGEDE